MTTQHEAARREASRDAAPKSYPADRFDNAPRSGRVGAHRITPQPRVVWQFIVGGLVATLLLTALGVIGVNFMNSRGSLPVGSSAPGEPAAPQVQAELDPDASVVVLDGTPAAGELALNLASIITEENLGSISFAGPAETTDVEISAVFFSDDANESAAKGLAKELGGISSYPTSDYEAYDAQLVVLLGADYAGPGLEGSEAD